jgi:hypothetical protein
MPQIDWTPFVISLEVFAAFVAVCFIGVVGDFWFKPSRRSARAEPIRLYKGERIFLN